MIAMTAGPEVASARRSLIGRYICVSTRAIAILSQSHFSRATMNDPVDRRLDIRALRFVKIVHTLVWALFAGCILAIPVVAWRGDVRRELGRAVAVARGKPEPSHPRGIRELACRPDPHLTRAHEEHAAHRRSGPSSSRHPPLDCGGTLRALNRTTSPASIAMKATRRPRRRFFMLAESSEGGPPR